MNTIRKQIGYLYTSSVLGNLSLTGAWVAILAALFLRYRQEYLRMYLEEKIC